MHQKQQSPSTTEEDAIILFKICATEIVDINEILKYVDERSALRQTGSERCRYHGKLEVSQYSFRQKEIIEPRKRDLRT
jgi:hypothetical protein